MQSSDLSGRSYFPLLLPVNGWVAWMLRQGCLGLLGWPTLAWGGPQKPYHNFLRLHSWLRCCHPISPPPFSFTQDLMLSQPFLAHPFISQAIPLVKSQHLLSEGSGLMELTSPWPGLCLPWTHASSLPGCPWDQIH